MNPVQVVGCDASGFSAEAREVLRHTELLLGGRRSERLLRGAVNGR